MNWESGVESNLDKSYDVIVVGGGLGGLTAANHLARRGQRVLLAEQHSEIGGLAAYFKRKSHVIDVSLHGFPIGMKKSFRKYWGKEFSERIIQVRNIRFDNPQFQLKTTFDTEDFTRILIEKFGVEARTVNEFFDTLSRMNYYDDRSERNRDLFERFFPGRTDVWRLLMEPITYANGSSLDEPAITYGIVFGNFMSKGVYTFLGGTDLLISMMRDAMGNNGVTVETNALVDKVLVENGRVDGAMINGKPVKTRAVVSNGNLVRTVRDLVGLDHFGEGFRAMTDGVKLSNSSCQVYIGLKPGEKIEPIGDLLFTSEYPEFDADAICSRDITSRTYSVYYPEIRPGSNQYTVVASMNARYDDWAGLDRDAYRASKKDMIEDTLDHLDRYIPGIRGKVDYTEAGTPRTFERYTLHEQGASFGTKFEGLDVSTKLSEEIPGLFHTGSVGIIMSGWLGSVNYGVIKASEVEKYLGGLE